jgi:hypothetical protein
VIVAIAIAIGIGAISGGLDSDAIFDPDFDPDFDFDGVAALIALGRTGSAHSRSDCPTMAL